MDGAEVLEIMSSALFWQSARAGLRVASLGAMRLAIPAAAIIGLSACVVAPPPPRTVAVPAPPPQKVFVYPANGQSAEQTDRDRYECHVWAVQQTGVDPSRADANPYERVIVQPANPPGSATAPGATGGAIWSALNGRPRAPSTRTRTGPRWGPAYRAVATPSLSYTVTWLNAIIMSHRTQV